jgi:hypothetical protein
MSSAIFHILGSTKNDFFNLIGGGFSNHDVDVHNTYNYYNETNNISQTDNSVTNIDSESKTTQQTSC